MAAGLSRCAKGLARTLTQATKRPRQGLSYKPNQSLGYFSFLLVNKASRMPYIGPVFQNTLQRLMKVGEFILHRTHRGRP